MTTDQKLDLLLAKFSAQEERTQKLEENFEALRVLVLSMGKHMAQSFARIDSNFEALEARLNELEAKLDILARDTGKDFSTVKGELDSIKHEIRKIEKVSPYNEQYENLLRIAR